MADQPEALRLADFLDDQYDPSHNLEEAAAELRRLHAVNQELLEALEKIADWHGAYGPFPENNVAWRGMAVVTARESVTALRDALAQQEQEQEPVEEQK